MKKLLILFVILFCGLWINYTHLNDQPSSIHAWAQAEHYAITKGFIQNHLNFFKPECYLYNKEFPNLYTVRYTDTQTAVDFPLTNYIPAVFMCIFEINAPWVYRVFVLLWSFLGLWYLFKLAQFLTKNFIKSLFVLVFVASSPFFIYYQANFLPSVPSFSTAVIGIYYYILYLQEGKRKYIWIGVLSLTLAALMRMSFLIPFLTVLGVEFLRGLRKKIKIQDFISLGIVAIIIFGSYFLYNNYLRSVHGSQFLNVLKPPVSWDEFKYFIFKSDEFWRYHFFSRFHYYFFFGLGILGIVYISIKKGIAPILLSFLLLTSIILLGYLLFGFAMLDRYVDHDYYFLDSFFLPIALLLIFILSVIPLPKFKFSEILWIVIIIVFGIFSYKHAIRINDWRRAAYYWNDDTQMALDNFENSESFLDSLHIPKEAKILTIRDYAPNLPYIYMNRKGYFAMKSKSKDVHSALDWDYDYIVLENNSDVLELYPIIQDKTIPFAKNNTLTVLKKHSKENEVFGY